MATLEFNSWQQAFNEVLSAIKKNDANWQNSVLLMFQQHPDPSISKFGQSVRNDQATALQFQIQQQQQQLQEKQEADLSSFSSTVIDGLLQDNPDRFKIY